MKKGIPLAGAGAILLGLWVGVQLHRWYGKSQAKKAQVAAISEKLGLLVAPSETKVIYQDDMRAHSLRLKGAEWSAPVYIDETERITTEVYPNTLVWRTRINMDNEKIYTNFSPANLKIPTNENVRVMEFGVVPGQQRKDALCIYTIRPKAPPRREKELVY